MEIHRVSTLLKVTAEPDPPPLHADLEIEVGALWNAEVKIRGQTIFNGSLFSVSEWKPDCIRGFFVEYRLYVAQQRHPDLFKHLCVRPLAISGMINSPDGLIFGRRSADLASNPTKWELAPSGGISSESRPPAGTVDYMRQFYTELIEELGISESEVSGTSPFALIEDQSTHVFDIVLAADTNMGAGEIRKVFLNASGEYSELKFVPVSTLGYFLNEYRRDIIAETAALLEFVDCGSLFT
jgi:hypothetical protein